ncbi:MAG TPA: TIGR03085 family metal-binding protein [Acidimicrobiia bacterium]
MSAAEILRAERASLCDTFEKVGADAPTLCEGWVTADLAAHLIVREHRPDALPGVLLGGPFARHTDHLMERAKATGYDAMIARLRTGLPLVFRVGPGALANVVENWIHHEDVRRANGEGPRPADAEVDAFLWRTLGLSGRLAARKVKGFGLELDAGAGRHLVARDAEPRVVVRGAPGEMVLYFAGRKAAAQLELDGPDDAIQALRDAKFGL